MRGKVCSDRKSHFRSMDETGSCPWCLATETDVVAFPGELHPDDVQWVTREVFRVAQQGPQQAPKAPKRARGSKRAR